MSDAAHPMLPYDPATGSGDDVDKSIALSEYRALVDYLRALREHAGLTQAQLAERIDETQKFVSTYETYQRRLDVHEFRVIATAIGGPAAPVVALFAVLDAMVDAMAADGGDSGIAHRT